MDIFGQKKAKFKLAHKVTQMKDKTTLENMGNVLHEYDEGQNHAWKYGKCPS
jgi:hypothetical protein